MFSPNYPTSNTEDVFSSNFSNYTTASPGNISPDPPDNLSKNLLASPAISPFYNVQAYNAANKPPIPSPDPITPSVILTPSLVLPPLPLFDPRRFFVPEELLPPKKEIHPPSSSSTTLSNSSHKQSSILPPCPILSLSPMFDSQYLFPSKDISPKDTETPVESPIPVPPYSSEGSSLDYLFDESIFVELDNSLWIISRPLKNKPIPKEPNKLDAC
nr:hypothetical protein [Tanacetum cinerariifolium]